jgi:hypothetical protein
MGRLFSNRDKADEPGPSNALPTYDSDSSDSSDSNISQASNEDDSNEDVYRTPHRQTRLEAAHHGDMTEPQQGEVKAASFSRNPGPSSTSMSEFGQYITRP